MTRPLCRTALLVGLWVAAVSLGCVARDARPSILLVVIDTLRADAVSAYGGVKGTTPQLDRLAAAGLRYTRAFAPSPWTVPSHASLLTGLAIQEHRAGVYGPMGLGAEATTIAERLRAAGYHTAGFSENPLVSETFGMAQGFEHYRSVTVAQLTAEALGQPHAHFELVEALKAWAGAGVKTPFFVFVNLFDVHDPYQVRDENPFLPDGISVAEAKRVSATPVALCNRLPPRRELDILRGLYLGEVAEADRKLGQVVEVMRGAAAGEIVTIVTADHGELLGEHRLLGHKFSLSNSLLHVPLVVHGAPAGAAGEIEQPVALRDVAASILAWAGEPSGAPEWRPLPLEPDDESPPRPLIAAWVDQDPTTTAALPPGAAVAAGALDVRRAGCGDADRVFGDMFSLTRFPFKLTWFEHHAAQLHDLSWDEREISDLAPNRPELAAELADELAAAREEIRGDAAAAPEPDVRKLEALQGLGYVE